MSRTSTMILIAVVMALISTGCAHSPRAIEVSPSVLAIRGDFLDSNPDGPFNIYIERGEVVRGMNFVEVLASWGAPRARYRTESETVGTVEYWHYFWRDETSQDWTQFTFVFERKQLAEWDITRHVSKNGSLSVWRAQDSPVHPVLDPPVGTSSLNTVKK
jgi:hypothetical protein